MPKDLPFSRDEFRARLLNVRQDIAARGLAGLLVHTPENIYYLTGYHTLGYYRYQTCIVLILGYPGVGKRTVGSHLAQMLDGVMVDNQLINIPLRTEHSGDESLYKDEVGPGMRPP